MAVPVFHRRIAKLGFVYLVQIAVIRKSAFHADLRNTAVRLLHHLPRPLEPPEGDIFLKGQTQHVPEKMRQVRDRKPLQLRDIRQKQLLRIMVFHIIHNPAHAFALRIAFRAFLFRNQSPGLAAEQLSEKFREVTHAEEFIARLFFQIGGSQLENQSLHLPQKLLVLRSHPDPLKLQA